MQQHVESTVSRVSLTPGFPGVQPSPKAYCHSQLQLVNSFSKPQGMTLVVCVGSVFRALVFSSFWQEHTIRSLEFKPQPLLSGYPAIMTESWLYLFRVPSTLILLLLGAKGECATGLGLQLVSARLPKLSCPQVPQLHPFFLRSGTWWGNWEPFISTLGERSLDGKKITFAGNGQLKSLEFLEFLFACFQFFISAAQFSEVMGSQKQLCESFEQSHLGQLLSPSIAPSILERVLNVLLLQQVGNVQKSNLPIFALGKIQEALNSGYFGVTKEYFIHLVLHKTSFVEFCFPVWCCGWNPGFESAS